MSLLRTEKTHLLRVISKGSAFQKQTNSGDHTSSSDGGSYKNTGNEKE